MYPKTLTKRQITYLKRMNKTEHTDPKYTSGAVCSVCLYLQILASNSAGVNAITLLPEKSLTFLVII